MKGVAMWKYEMNVSFGKTREEELEAFLKGSIYNLF